MKVEEMITLDIPRLKEACNDKGINSFNRRKARHKLAILERDGFKCKKCGSVDNLTIAHIFPNRHINDNYYKLDICETLCSHCHFSQDEALNLKNIPKKDGK